MTTVKPCWHVHHKGLEALVTTDTQGRPTGVQILNRDELTTADAKKLTSPTVTNAIKATQALEAT